MKVLKLVTFTILIISQLVTQTYAAKSFEEMKKETKYIFNSIENAEDVVIEDWNSPKMDHGSKELRKFLVQALPLRSYRTTTVFINYKNKNKFGYRHIERRNINLVKRQLKLSDELIEMIPKEFDDLHKLDYLYRYISLLPYKRNPEYKNTGITDQHAISLFEGGGVCSAKSELLTEVLYKIGINTYNITISPKDKSVYSDSHILNLIEYKKKWYFLDPTWGSYNTGNEKFSSEMKFTSHTYFMFGKENFDKYYKDFKTFEMPENIEISKNNLEDDLGVDFNTYFGNKYINLVSYQGSIESPKNLNIFKPNIFSTGS